MHEYYQDLIENLKEKICQEYGTIRNFCQKKGLSESSLSKIFNGQRKISVKLFIKITNALNLSGCDNSTIEENISLTEYMEMPHDLIMSLIFKIVLK